MVVVIFRSRRTPQHEADYREVAARMRTLAESMPGFVSFRSFSSPDEEYVSLIEFESLDELEAWRDHPEHREAQEAGRERFYSEYSVQVCQPIRESFFTSSGNSANKKL